jgi:hypothetical protein
MLGGLAVAGSLFAIAAPAASARTVTLTKVFVLKSNATTTYALPGKATTLSDAGYILAGPGFKVREDNLVEPYPHQPHDLGQITRGRATVLAVGVKTHGFGFQVRVKTATLNGRYTLTLYAKYPA